MKNLIVFALPLLCMMAGCSDAPSVIGPKAFAAADKAPESEILCLAEAGNDADELDARLRAAQRNAQQHRDDADAWVEVGRQWVREARLRADSGFYLNVDGCVEQALAFSTGYPAALNLRALVLMNTHQFEAARASSERLLKSNPDDVLALGTLSDALLELGRYAESLAAAQRQMSAFPGMAAHSRGAYLSWLHGDSARAKLLIRDALHGRSRVEPEAAAWAFVEAARIFWHEGDLSGADALLKESLNWVADYPAALVLRARIALARQDAAAAIELLVTAHQRQRSVESAWLLHDAYAMQGDAERAESWFKQAERLGAQGDRLSLGLMLAVLDRDPERAVVLLKEERALRAGIYVDDAYAWALYRAGHVDEAAGFSAQALRLHTPDARLLYHAGAVQIAQGRRGEGQKLIRRALALNPHFDAIEAIAANALLATDTRVAIRP
jgi:tetratricopeptide (TPR) repeat protein